MKNICAYNILFLQERISPHVKNVFRQYVRIGSQLRALARGVDTGELWTGISHCELANMLKSVDIIMSEKSLFSSKQQKRFFLSQNSDFKLRSDFNR